MNKTVEYFSNEPFLLLMLIIAGGILISTSSYFINQNKIYGSYFQFAPQSKKILALGSLLIVSLLLFNSTKPQEATSSQQIAIVLGNTQNSPYPALSPEVEASIEETLLQQKDKTLDEMIDSITVISAVKSPRVVKLDVSKLKLKEIGRNSSNAKRTARDNTRVIKESLRNIPPSSNGANYFEAMLEARNNVSPGSKIIVIGSGLSDNGDLNFSTSKLLTDEEVRINAIEDLKTKYGRDYFADYVVQFYGLGNTTKPQEELSNMQKEIVRDFYSEVVRSLGGTALIDTATLVGDQVATKFLVGTTDTGCGDVGFVFDNDSVEFIANTATFANPITARTSLTSVKEIWDQYGESIQAIQVDGYIAHFPGADTVSQPRAETVKSALVEMGIPEKKISATGRGFGPHKLDSQNRIVKVTVTRASDLCQI